MWKEEQSRMAEVCYLLHLEKRYDGLAEQEERLRKEITRVKRGLRYPDNIRKEQVVNLKEYFKTLNVPASEVGE